MIIAGITIAYALLLDGCASPNLQGEVDLDESLRVKAEEYWKLRMEDEYIKIYEMEEQTGLPKFEYYRKKVSAMKRIKINSYVIRGVSIQDDKGIVDIEFSFELPQVSKPFTQAVKDQWVFKNGKWWHILE